MQIDPRGPRFGAAITTLVFAAALLLGPTNGLVLVALQALVFACGAILGLRFPDSCTIDDLDNYFVATPSAKIIVLAEHAGDRARHGARA